ncbi:hypothetical protein J1N35_018158 [Gossypium stocksii]|uniref:Reverse transcriptase zinc-binding domain-containing protein n=1 Tax=Gossypium stocksii TaxID=47602 RepID=A0A9D3VNF9_9ROSI|nr:hypothetical protein J1N35_018158 [Gossypium stocksii]
MDVPRLQHTSLFTFYTNLWNINVPGKIRIHLWKVINECMLMLHNLQLRRLIVNTTYPVCHEKEETVSHLFRDCKFTQ